MIIQCKSGGEMLFVAEGQDPHAALDANGCGHCMDGHGPDVHCGHAANMCPRAHPGPCWNPPTVPERPDGCTVCRPITFFANAAFAPAPELAQAAEG